MKRVPLILALLATTTYAALAQDGVSTAGLARSKYLATHGEMPSSREIAVEEFVNYHRHELPRPKAGQAVAIDLRWGSSTVSRRGESVLQIGLSTALAGDRSHLRPLNLGLVIDVSGSMADHDKLERVKQALLLLVARLRTTDTLSLVTFDSSAQVQVPAQRLSEPERVNRVINGLRPGSSTNLEAGLRLGFEEVLKHFDRQATNRVILLTDGIANQGVIDPDNISNESRSYNDRGIDLSTIGVGQDLNKDLLRGLAKSGRGLFHFIADDEDIQKVFDKELQSLLSPVAQHPELEIMYGPGMRLQQVYGYAPVERNNSILLHLDTMNSGMTQVVLVRFKSMLKEAAALPVQVRLRYRDLDRNCETTLSDQISLKVGSPGSTGDLEDSSVAKNFTIADLAQSIKEMALAYEANNPSKARAMVSDAVDRTVRRYPNLEDAEIRRVLAMAVKYRDLLPSPSRDDAGGETDSRPRQAEASYLRAPNSRANLVPNGNFMQGNHGFVSDREYIKPSPNCLWGGYYTVVPAFNSPFQLHTNVVAQPFSAPGGGQVLFMNTGGKDQFVVWSTRVHCKPHTQYRISFYEIGLSGGPEWVNSYEIRVNHDRSEPQLGGDGQYVKISFDWTSGGSPSETLSIVRTPNSHGGGVVGLSNIEMVPVTKATQDYRHL